MEGCGSVRPTQREGWPKDAKSDGLLLGERSSYNAAGYRECLQRLANGTGELTKATSDKGQMVRW